MQAFTARPKLTTILMMSLALSVSACGKKDKRSPINDSQTAAQKQAEQERQRQAQQQQAQQQQAQDHLRQQQDDFNGAVETKGAPVDLDYERKVRQGRDDRHSGQGPEQRPEQGPYQKVEVEDITFGKGNPNQSYDEAARKSPTWQPHSPVFDDEIVPGESVNKAMDAQGRFAQTGAVDSQGRAFIDIHNDGVVQALRQAFDNEDDADVRRDSLEFSGAITNLFVQMYSDFNDYTDNESIKVSFEMAGLGDEVEVTLTGWINRIDAKNPGLGFDPVVLKTRSVKIIDGNSKRVYTGQDYNFVGVLRCLDSDGGCQNAMIKIEQIVDGKPCKRFYAVHRWGDGRFEAIAEHERRKYEDLQEEARSHGKKFVDYLRFLNVAQPKDRSLSQYSAPFNIYYYDFVEYLMNTIEANEKQGRYDAKALAAPNPLSKTAHNLRFRTWSVAYGASIYDISFTSNVRPPGVGFYEGEVTSFVGPLFHPTSGKTLGETVKFGDEHLKFKWTGEHYEGGEPGTYAYLFNKVGFGGISEYGSLRFYIDFYGEPQSQLRLTINSLVRPTYVDFISQH